jgi:hypothetical protein
MPVIVHNQGGNSSFVQGTLLAAAEPVTIEHGHSWFAIPHPLDGALREPFHRKRLERKSFALYPSLDSRRTSGDKKRRAASGTPPTLRKRQTSHDVAGSNLNSALGANNQVPWVFQSHFSGVLMLEP